MSESEDVKFIEWSIIKKKTVLTGAEGKYRPGLWGNNESPKSCPGRWVHSASFLTN